MAAVVDVDINEGDTFIMTIEMWSDEDNTIPIDVSGSTFTGSFKFGTRIVPMSCIVSGVSNNVLTAKVEYTQMANLPTQGKYDIDQLDNASNEKFRLIQGAARVDQEVTV